MVPIVLKKVKQRWIVSKGHARLVMGPRGAYRWAADKNIRDTDVPNYSTLKEACLAVVRFEGQEG
ncbi:MAG: hypothetical protein E6Q97_35325 [Desulfurellales bacterium]|nr:MAG: hypothetical protein E6Q97_35325 [Desulfurellales bacterium]